MHINDSYRLSNGENEIVLTVDLAEMMGSDVYIYSKIDEKEVIAKVRMNNNVSPNGKVKLYIDTEKPHVFDKETHKLICD